MAQLPFNSWLGQTGGGMGNCASLFFSVRDIFVGARLQTKPYIEGELETKPHIQEAIEVKK